MKSKLKHLNIPIKSMQEDGTFLGYGSVFGIKDSYGDVVVKGAFVNSLVQKMPKMLWQHRADTPIGVFTAAQEDEHGLRLEGKLTLDSTMGKDAYALMKAGAVDGLSIGYYLNKYELNKEEKTLYIKEADLLEVSLVTFPANEAAQVEAVKTQFLSSELNKAAMDMQSRMEEIERRMTEVEATLCNENAEGSDELSQKAQAEAKTHASGADDGAIEAVEALNNLLASIKAGNL